MRVRQSAFTLVELLIVIAIIGVLIALLMPGVQAAREAARRLDCQSHLKQIGQGIQNYHSAMKMLPAGNVTKTAGICHGDATAGVDYPSEDGPNWLISILPYVEEQALYKQYDFSEFNESYQNAPVRTSRVGLYVCPSDQETNQMVVPATGPACPFALNLPYMPGTYRAVTGRSDGFQFLDSGEVLQYPKQWRGPIHTVGIFGYRQERIKDITDGTSKTLMAGEMITRTQPAFRTLWAYSYSHYSLSSVTPQSRTWLGDYDRCMAIGGDGSSLPCRRGWGAYHSGGMNFILCDGSGRFINDNVDPEIFAELATIDGREVATLRQ